MKVFRIIPVLIMALMFIYCGNNSVTEQAESAIQNLEKETSSAKCNGKGTAFTGKYKIIAAAGKIKCEGAENADLPEASFELDCKQAETAFACAISEFKWNGCINQDGSFIVGVKGGIGYMQSLSEMTEGASSVQSSGKLSGKIEGDGGKGKLDFALLATTPKEKKGCTGLWPVTLELIQAQSENQDTEQTLEETGAQQ